MRVALAQLNPTVGDFAGNLAMIEKTLSSLADSAPDLVVFPELFVMGYPPRDLLEKTWFLDRADRALNRLKDLTRGNPDTGVLIGTARRTGRDSGKGLYNSAILMAGGEILAERQKSLLPTYDVFDEARYFDPADSVEVVPFGNESLGITVCEDAWNEPGLCLGRPYESDPVARLASRGATIILNISASPFHVGKDEIRYRLIRNHAIRHNLPFVLVNQIGGNDDLIFDGASMFVGPDGGLVASLPSFAECVRIVDTADARGGRDFVPEDHAASVFRALVLGLRDYVRKCGFDKAVVGLSGGIDSAVTCSIAVSALGAENVLGVSMPSPYSSRGSIEDSRTLAANLGIRFEIVSIDEVYSSFLNTLERFLGDPGVDITEENIQARIRGNILMALSNEFGNLVLSTGNKSELAVGYCTLYGDMSGGLAVISDVPKTMVYDIAEHINADGEIIPRATMVKPPSAELRPSQLDQDTLPPYETLDLILDLYVDRGMSLEQIVSHGVDHDVATRVIRDVNRSEYKRRQAAPGLRVTSKAFGAGRRMPIAAVYEP